MENLHKFVDKQSQCTNLVHCDKPNDELEMHFLYEFILDNSFKYSYMYITEMHSSYIGQKELIIDLAKEIYKKIKLNNEENVFTITLKDLQNYSNIFFDKLIIKLVYDGTGYLVNRSEYNVNTKKFNIIYIKLAYYDCTEYTNIVRCLMHEMLHAYNNYESYIKNAKFNLSDLTKISYNKTLAANNDLSISNICKRIVNNISKLEQNAYINELNVALNSNNFNISKYHNTINAYKDAVEIFKKTAVWEQYCTLYAFINDYMIITTNDEKQEFVNTYNYINNSKLTFEKIIKKINSQFTKIFKKMETLIPKIFYDYYQKQLNENCEQLIRSSTALIDFLNNIKTFKYNKGIWTIS